MECPICFEVISNSCYASCSHHFCYKCLKKWCNKGGIRCPMCKGRMFQIILDKEFDLINNPKNKEKLEKEYTKTIYVNFNDNISPGITLTNRKSTTKDVHVSGVVVSNLEKNRKLREYLKPGNVILYLNGVPCIKPSDSIDIIRHYYEKGEILKIELENEKKPESSLFICFTNLLERKKKVVPSN